jgi:hypothetical protein
MDLFRLEHQADGWSKTDPGEFCTHRGLSASAERRSADEDFVFTW